MWLLHTGKTKTDPEPQRILVRQQGLKWKVMFFKLSGQTAPPFAEYRVFESGTDWSLI